LPNPGINSSSAVVGTIKFRVKSSETATLKFDNSTQILANDGVGTNILTSKTPAVYALVIAPPDGSTITSTTHPDQNAWYNSRTASFSWEEISGASSYSFTIDNSPKTIPPQKSAANETNTTLEVETDGIWIFHVRALVGKTWGGTSHYLVRIDSTPPVKFVVGINKKVINPTETP